MDSGGSSSAIYLLLPNLFNDFYSVLLHVVWCCYLIKIRRIYCCDVQMLFAI